MLAGDTFVAASEPQVATVNTSPRYLPYPVFGEVQALEQAVVVRKDRELVVVQQASSEC